VGFRLSLPWGRTRDRLHGVLIVRPWGRRKTSSLCSRCAVPSAASTQKARACPCPGARVDTARGARARRCCTATVSWWCAYALTRRMWASSVAALACARWARRCLSYRNERRSPLISYPCVGLGESAPSGNGASRLAGELPRVTLGSWLVIESCLSGERRRGDIEPLLSSSRVAWSRIFSRYRS
jgi:hypothetical protein